MNQPEQSAPEAPYHPSQGLGVVLSVLARDAGSNSRVWDLLEWLVDSQGVGDVNALVASGRFDGTLGVDKSRSLINAVARLGSCIQTRPRRTRMIEHLLAAGADPWVGDAAAGIVVLSAGQSAVATRGIINHPSFPGWEKLASEREFGALLRHAPKSYITQLLDLGMPLSLSLSSYSTPQRLVDICENPDVVDDLVRRGAPVGKDLLDRITKRQLRPGPVIMETILRQQGTKQGQDLAAAILNAGLAGNAPGQIKVGVVLCGPAAIKIVAGTIDQIARTNGLLAITMAASRRAIELDDDALAQMCGLVQSLAMKGVDMDKLRAKAGMAWLGARVEDLATRLACGDVTLQSSAIPALAGVASGIVPTPWLARWEPGLPGIERCDRLLARCSVSPIESMTAHQLVFWRRRINNCFGGLSPTSLFRTFSYYATDLQHDAQRWQEVVGLATTHTKAGGLLPDQGFVYNLEKVIRERSTSRDFQSNYLGDIPSQINSIRVHFDRQVMETATPAVALVRPAPRM